VIDILLFIFWPCVTGFHGRSVIGPTQLGHWALDDRQNGSVERINERIDIEWIGQTDWLNGSVKR
jgi:hypothetical protein